MAYTLYEAQQRSVNKLAKGVFKSLVTTDEMLPLVRFKPISGESHTYNREKTLPSVEFVDPNHSSLAESSATFEKITVPLRRIVSNIDIDMFAEEQMDDEGDLVAMQLDKKLRALGRTISQKAIGGSFVTGATFTLAGVTFTSASAHLDSDRHGPGDLRYTTAGTLLQFRAPGDTKYGASVNVGVNGTYSIPSDNPSRSVVVTVVAGSLPGSNTEANIYFTTSTNEVDGLFKLIEPSQTRLATGANGDALSFAILDQLREEMVKTNGMLAYVGNSKMKIKFLELLRSAAGNTAETLNIPGFNGPVPSYRKIPFVVNDWIPSNEAKGSGTTLSSVSLIDFADDGFYMPVGQGSKNALVDGDPMKTRVLGIKVRNVGELEGKEATRYRVSWYGNCALGSKLAAARASQLITA